MSNQPLEKQEERKRKAVSLAYPVKPDGKGSARVNFCGKAYYFGAHNSRESFSAFGEWRRQMIESGEATEPKLLRLDMVNEQSTSEVSGPVGHGTTQLRLLIGLACLLILGVAIFATSKFSSTAATPSVDGQALTVDEMELIRKIRNQQADFLEIQKELQPSVAELTLQLVAEGPRNGKRHQDTLKLPGS